MIKETDKIRHESAFLDNDSIKEDNSEFIGFSIR
jgi:hypothetical protein